ncbi:MAG: methylhydantoinase, partial [Chloroflexi bacterium]|nr:methylhydantoinase [Chloroflexota bacterium]
TPLRTAAAIHDVVSESMAEAARAHLVERNWDPRRVTLVAFGGAGPAHAATVARKLGVSRIVFPVGAGATSALGSLVAPLSFTYARSLPARVREIDWDAVNRALGEMAALGLAALAEASVAAPDVRVVREADVHIRGQVFELTVPVPDGTLDARSIEPVREAFAATYRRLYSRHHENGELEVVSWKVTAVGPRRTVALGAAALAGDAVKGARPIRIGPGPGVQATVYDRYRLAAGAVLEGPALVEERETTIVLPPGGRARVDAHGSIVLDLGA